MLQTSGMCYSEYQYNMSAHCTRYKNTGMPG